MDLAAFAEPQGHSPLMADLGRPALLRPVVALASTTAMLPLSFVCTTGTEP